LGRRERGGGRARCFHGTSFRFPAGRFKQVECRIHERKVGIMRYVHGTQGNKVTGATD
jgi:hypothetical protein